MMTHFISKIIWGNDLIPISFTLKIIKIQYLENFIGQLLNKSVSFCNYSLSYLLFNKLISF